jgi:hypothetical protein
MSSAPRSPEPFRAAVIARAPVGAPLEAALTPYTDAGGPDAVVALAALRAALLGFARTHQRAARDPQARGIDRWENEGGRLGSRRARDSNEGLFQRPEPRAWAAHEVSQDDVSGAVRAYTCTLRRAGLALAPTMSAVDVAVRRYATAYLSVDTCSDVQRDAARSCLVAYYGV